LRLACFLLLAGAGAAVRADSLSLSYHVHAGDVAAVRALLEQGTDPNLRTQEPFSATVLMTAASRGDAEMIRTLLAAGARVNAKDSEGQTALLIAANRGSTEAVKALLAAKADTDVSVYMLGGGRTPLMMALSTGNVEMARALLEAGASVYITTSYGATALRFAMWHDTPEMRQLVQQMLAAGAEVDAGRAPPPPGSLSTAPGGAQAVRTVRSAEGTALGDVAAHGGAEMARILLAAGASVDARQTGWKTPLMLAAARGNTALVRLLLESGADAQARDAAGKTALDLALAGGPTEVAQLLRDATAATARNR
jgi:serine/threonine-protein phosphatase 6 regulatory ankyrin repeat subunit B